MIPPPKIGPDDTADSGAIVDGPVHSVEPECERILRSLPEWFGIEQSLIEYVRNTSRFPTFVAKVSGEIVAFATLIEHFPTSWEVHCIAVEAALRGKGIGKHLHDHVEKWLFERGVLVLQVKTIAASHPSRAYAETRAFYAAAGYVPVEIFPRLWASHLPVLQLIKTLRHANSPSGGRVIGQ